MSLHSLVEPAGTLTTGWKLVPGDDRAADVRNADRPSAPARADEDAAPPPEPVTPSKWELAEIG